MEENKTESQEELSYDALLKSNSLKVTPQRMAILGEIEKHCHISIEDIYENIQKMYPSISLATIYKNITSMVECNILKEVKIPGHKSRYELAKLPHSHFACTQCGYLEHIDTSGKDLIKKTPKLDGFEVNDVLVTFIGVCPNCMKKAS